jgi:hypothetical protein
VASGSGRGLSAILKADVNGEKVFVFESEKELLPEHQEIHRHLSTSRMIDFVFSLRNQGMEEHHSVHGNYATNDTPETPLYIHLGEGLGQMGPAAASSFRLLERNSNTRSDTILVLSPLRLRGAVLQVSDFISQQYFAAMIAHETFHMIMGDIYGDKLLELKARSTSRKAHDSHVETDEFMSFLEGTAEAMEIAIMEMFPSEVSSKLLDIPGQAEPVRNFIKDFKKRRLVTAARNKFIFAENGETLDGVIKKPESLIKTEGAIASLFYRVLFKSRVENPFEKVINVMARTKPLTFLDFLRDFCRIWPNDAPIVMRQFLESTHYVTASEQAFEVYRNNYLLKKAWKQKKVDNETMTRSNEFFRSFRLGLYNSIMAGELAFDANISQPYVLVDENMFFELDFNSATAEDLQDFFSEFFTDILSEQEIQASIVRLLKRREQNPFAGEPSFGLGGEAEMRLAQYRSFYMSHVENSVQKGMQMLKEGIYSSFVQTDSASWFQLLLGPCHTEE